MKMLYVFKNSLYRITRNSASIILVPVKILLKNIATYALGPTVAGIRRGSLLEQIRANALATSADYVMVSMQSAVLFDTSRELWKHALNQNLIRGVACEFGVFRGNSINFFARILETNSVEKQGILIHGFDSFLGLQEDWSGSNAMLKGHFSLNGKLPKVSERVELHQGFFNYTLPGFLAKNPEKFSFIHLDADTYQSTKYVLETVISRITIGTIIVFDEYLGYPSWQTGEFLAWQEIVKAHNIKYSYLGLSTAATSVRVEAIGNLLRS